MDDDAALALLDEMQDARERGDWDEYLRLLPGLPMTPEWLSMMVQLFGVETIRSLRIDTSLADQRWGPGGLSDRRRSALGHFSVHVHVVETPPDPAPRGPSEATSEHAPGPPSRTTGAATCSSTACARAAPGPPKHLAARDALTAGALGP